MQVPSHVEYERATSVEHALALLGRPEHRVLAGGHSLIPMMKLRLAQPGVLVDINGLAELAYIKLDGGQLRIGALARHADLLDSKVSGPALPDLPRRRTGRRGPDRPPVGHHRRVAVPGRPVRGPVRGVRRGARDRGHPRPGRRPGGPGARVPPRPVRDRHRPGRAAGRDPGAACTPARGARTRRWRAGSATGRWPPPGRCSGWKSSTIKEAGIGLTAVAAEHFVAAEAEDCLRGKPATEENFASRREDRRRALPPRPRPARARGLQAPPGRRAHHPRAAVPRAAPPAAQPA